MEYAYFHQQKSWISTLHDCKGRIQLRRFTGELANFPKALSVITAIIRRVGHWRGWRGTTWSGVLPPGAPCSAWSPWTWDIKHYKVTQKSKLIKVKQREREQRKLKNNPCPIESGLSDILYLENKATTCAWTRCRRPWRAWSRGGLAFPARSWSPWTQAAFLAYGWIKNYCRWWLRIEQNNDCIFIGHPLI